MSEFFNSRRDIPIRVGNISPMVLIRISENKQVEAFYSHTNKKWVLTGYEISEGKKNKMKFCEEHSISGKVNKNAVLWTYWS